MKKIIIIPAYNEGKNILGIVKRISESASDFDVIVINDGSTDETENVLTQNGINHVVLPVNLGIGGAMQTGYIYAKENGYDFAVQVDGDGQHDPSEVVKLLSAQEKVGADLVIGSRFLSEKSFRSTALRRFGIIVFSFVTKILLGQRISDATSGFRLANKKVIDVFSKYYPSDYPEPEVLVTLANSHLKIIETPVKMKERENGKSSITSLKSVYYMIKVIGSMVLEKVRG